MSDTSEPGMHLEPASFQHIQNSTSVLADVFAHVLPNGPGIEFEPGRERAKTHRELGAGEQPSFLDQLRKINDERLAVIRSTEQLKRVLEEANKASALPSAPEIRNKLLQQQDPDIPANPGWTSILDIIDTSAFDGSQLLTPAAYISEPPRITSVPTPPSENRYESHTDNTYHRKNATIAEFPTIHAPTTMTLAGNFSANFTTSSRPKNVTKRLSTPSKRERVSSSTSTRPAISTSAKRPYTTQRLTQPRPPTPSAAFVSSMSEVVFVSYVVGEECSKTIKLTNVSSSPKHVTIRPPKSDVFFLNRISNGKTSKTNGGNIAAGLFVQYEIKFSPKNLADVVDEIVVMCEGSPSFSIKVAALRPTPQLGLDTTLECGVCQLACEISKSFDCINSGATGKFRFVRLEDAPALESIPTLADDFWNHESLELGDFLLKPAALQLDAGAKSIIDVKFIGRKRGTCVEKIALVKDNCEVIVMEMCGLCETPNISIVTLTSDEPDISQQGIFPQTATMFFGQVNPDEGVQETITISNDSSLDLPFSWQQERNGITPHPTSSPTTDEGCTDGQFTLAPMTGVLLANETETFVVKYSSDTMRSSKQVATLTIHPPPESKIISLSATDNIDNNAHNNTDNTNNDTGATNTTNTTTTTTAPQLAFTAAKIELYAECEPFSFEVFPPTIMFPGELELHRLHTRDVRVHNTSTSPLKYTWDTKKVCASATISVSPPAGTISANGSQRFEITVEPTVHTFSSPLSSPSQILDEVMRCEINGGQTIDVSVHATMQKMFADFDIAAINFGAVEVGKTVSQQIPLRNYSGVDVEWKLSTSHRQHPDICALELSPRTGTLSPYGEVDVDVTFKPTASGILDDVIRCLMSDGSSTTTEVVGEAQVANVCLKSCCQDVGVLFVGVEKYGTICLQNLTALSTSYAIEKVVTSGASLKFHSLLKETSFLNDTMSPEEEKEVPARGSLPPRGSKDIGFSVVATTTGDFSVVASVIVVGMQDPVYVEVKGCVHGLTVEYSYPSITPSQHNEGFVSPLLTTRPNTCQQSRSTTATAMPTATIPVTPTTTTTTTTPPPPSAQSPMQHCVDFGRCQTYVPSAVRKVVITNKSAISARYSFRVLGFLSAIDATPTLRTTTNFTTSTQMMPTTKKLPAFMTMRKQTATHTMRKQTASQTMRKQTTPQTTMRPSPPPSAHRSRRTSASTNTVPGFLRTRGSSVGRPVSSKTGIQVADKDAFVDINRLKKLRYREAIAMLQNRKGMAVKISVSSAVLEPYSSIEVEIICCGDTWGAYTDILRCETDDLVTVDVELKVEIVGSPLIAQASGNGEDPLLLRLPSVAATNDDAVVTANTTPKTTTTTTTTPSTPTPTPCTSTSALGLHDSATSTRSAMLLNPSPFDIAITWRCFVTTQVSTLVDFLWQCDDDGGVSVRTRPHEGTTTLSPFCLTPTCVTQMMFAGTTYVKPATPTPPPTTTTRTPTTPTTPTRKSTPRSTTTRSTPITTPTTTKTKISSTSLTTIPSSRVVDVMFRSPNPGEFYGFVRGYGEFVSPDAIEAAIALSDEAVAAGVCVSRERKVTEDTSLKILLRGRAVTPRLAPLGVSDETMTFESTMQTTTTSMSRTITMVNTTEATLVCTIAITNAHPFVIEDVVAVGYVEGSNVVSLAPSATVQVTVRFDRGLVDSTTLISVTPRTTLTTLATPTPLAPFATSVGDDRKDSVCINDTLVFGFVDGSKHTIAITATVFFPDLALSHDAVDFGHVQLSATTEIVLRNQGNSATTWATHVEGSESFTCTPSQGSFEGFTSKIAHVEAKLFVLFKPTKAGAHAATLKITCGVTGAVVLVPLSGVGVIDGANVV